MHICIDVYIYNLIFNIEYIEIYLYYIMEKCLYIYIYIYIYIPRSNHYFSFLKNFPSDFFFFFFLTENTPKQRKERLSRPFLIDCLHVRENFSQEIHLSQEVPAKYLYVFILSNSPVCLI